MITRFAKITSRLSIALIVLFGIAACGGGGGSDGSGFLPDDGSNTVTFEIELLLSDPAGNPTNTITSTTPGTLSVTVSSKKNPAVDVLVTAVADVVVITPESGTALTNADGVATFQIQPGDALGAVSIEVSVTDDNGSVTQTLNLQVEAAALRLGSINNGVFSNSIIDVQPMTTLSPSGSGTLTIAVVDEDSNRVDTTEEVKITSECIASGLAVLNPVSPVSITGQATISYTAQGCEGDDDISASIVNGTGQAVGTVSIAPLTANSISFTQAEPDLIALKGTGGGSGRQESSTVTFQVLDSDNNPVPGVKVIFSLSTDIGDVTLGNDSDVSDSAGNVSTTVFSGNVATVVRVFASIEASAFSTTSDVLIISTGLPDQNSISLSATVLNIGGGLDFDGKTVTLTVRMADKFNNPVPDGTSALFTTEYGAIESSCVTTAGACSVTWTSQAPRFPTFNQDLVKTIFDSDYNCPSHNGSSGPCPATGSTDALGTIRGLRSTISVVAIGEEFFIDENGNGLYDKGEVFENLPEAFIDNNEDGVYTPAIGPQCPLPNTTASCTAEGAEENFSDFNNDGEYSLNVSPPEFPNGMYNGSLCPPEGDGVFCSRELVNVSDSLVLVMSADSTFSTVLVRQGSSQLVSVVQEGFSYTAYIADFYNNAPAGDKSVSLSTNGDCSVLGESTFNIPDSNARGALSAGPIQIEGDGCPGTMTITVGDSTRTYSCSTTVADPNNPPVC